MALIELSSTWQEDYITTKYDVNKLGKMLVQRLRQDVESPSDNLIYAVYVNSRTGNFGILSFAGEMVNNEILSRLYNLAYDWVDTGESFIGLWIPVELCEGLINNYDFAVYAYKYDLDVFSYTVV